ncbi:cytochrome c [Pedobacter sp. SYSU D00535]|uniref:c-type cytochrome n=1 Tax=Pedobacter sp. SYSU D00535 TaxID=2810308 RepID=UPI001A957C22|nr:cytochrome c [Pedobacter sp. SYSU D00535]
MKRSLLTLLIVSGVLLSASAQTKKPQTTQKASTTSSSAAVKASLSRGQAVYTTYCLPCHQADGGGVPGLNAPLIKTSQVLGSKPALINIILKGMQGVEIDGEMYSNAMPPMTHLTNQQIADVLTYVRNNFGNKASAVTVAEVNAVRKK